MKSLTLLSVSMIMESSAFHSHSLAILPHTELAAEDGTTSLSLRAVYEITMCIGKAGVPLMVFR